MSPEPYPAPATFTTLVFHKVQSGFSYGSTNYSPGRFLSLVETLEQTGCRLRLSFDDGYAHLADLLPHLVGRLAAPPLVFVPTAWLGKPNRWDYSSYFRTAPHLSAAQIRQLAQQGVAFGSHGHSHRDLTGLDEQQLQRELVQSREILSELAGRTIDSISYPFGRVGATVKNAAAAAGYRTGYTMRFPTSSDDKLSIGRIPVYGFDSRAAVLRRLRQGRGYGWERLKVSAVTALSGGTILLNRLRGM